jgi:hypothetical protein
MKKSKNIIHLFSHCGYKLIFGCTVVRNPHHCIVDIVSYFQLEKSMWTTNSVSDVICFYVLWKRHEPSVNHVNFEISLLKSGSTRTEYSFNLAYKMQRSKHNGKVEIHIHIVNCFIRAFFYLIHFRGHLENIESENRGYLRYLHRRARYDEKTFQFETWTLFIGMSRYIQNNINESVSIVMMNEIKWEGNQTCFISVIEDEFVYVSGKSPLSSPDENVEEWFIRLSDVSEDGPAVSTSWHVSNLINGFQCDEKTGSWNLRLCRSYGGWA